MGQKGRTGYPEEFCLAPFSSALLLHHVMKSQKGIFTKEEDTCLVMLVHNMSSSVCSSEVIARSKGQSSQVLLRVPVITGLEKKRQEHPEFKASHAIQGDKKRTKTIA